jgi:hypothetical protein
MGREKEERKGEHEIVIEEKICPKYILCIYRNA